MCIRDRDYADIQFADFHSHSVSFSGNGSSGADACRPCCHCAVSYTHLDVYKRQ